VREKAATSDDELMAAVSRGDPAAFAALFGRRKGDVYRFALHMTGSPAAADDITQDVFLTVMRDAVRFEAGRATVTAWLCGIARNYARRRTARELTLTTLPGQPGELEARLPAVDPDPVAEIARAERIAAVRRAVLRLPFKYREVIVLCDLQEMSYADAAAGLGCAVGTIRSRLHRGRALLADKLASSGAGPEPVKAHGPGCFA
jgi:RNA polymerase sigma-70 factor (ECF subfamily)